MWTQCTSVTDGRTDGRTDGQTELRSQRPCIAQRRTVKIVLHNRYSFDHSDSFSVVPHTAANQNFMFTMLRDFKNYINNIKIIVLCLYGLRKTQANYVTLIDIIVLSQLQAWMLFMHEDYGIEQNRTRERQNDTPERRLRGTYSHSISHTCICAGQTESAPSGVKSKYSVEVEAVPPPLKSEQSRLFIETMLEERKGSSSSSSSEAWSIGAQWAPHSLPWSRHSIFLKPRVGHVLRNCIFCWTRLTFELIGLHAYLHQLRIACINDCSYLQSCSYNSKLSVFFVKSTFTACTA